MASSILLVAGLGAGALAALAFALRTSEPRVLPFPSFELTTLFPELAVQPPADGAAAAPASRFDAALRRAVEPPVEPPAEPSGETRFRRVVPLGGELVGEIPTDRETWRWSTADGVTLILHQPPGGRPDVLVYAEELSPLIEERPTAEMHRFRVSLAPQGEVGAPFLGTFRQSLANTAAATGPRASRGFTDRARIAQVLASRTRGRGLGFDARHDSFTGWRWVGRNEQRVTLRFARWEGTWHEQRPLPTDLAAAVRSAAGDPPSVSLAPRDRLPARLLEGSAAGPAETSGAHLAILCELTPGCPAAKELSAFVASIRTERPDVIVNLRKEGVEWPFQELAAAAGLEIRKPEAGGVRDEGEAD